MAKKQYSITLAAASSDLRSLAEDRLAQKHLTTHHSALSTPSSPEELLKIVHEIEVQQIELEIQQEELRLSKDKLEKTLGMYTDLYDLAPLGYLTVEEDSTILEANLTAATILGVERSRLQGKHLKKFVIPEDHQVIDALLVKVFKKRINGNDEVMLVTDNACQAAVPHIISGRTVLLDASIHDITSTCRIILTDITKQKQTEDVLQRQSRALLATNYCNQALIHSTDEIELLHQVCKIIVEVGGYRMAWVGYAEHNDEKSVSVLAEAGFVADYKQHHKLSWADVPEGRGPVGVTIRTAQSIAVNHIPTDPIFQLWRDDALRHGFASLLTLPLKAASEAFGVLTIYSPKPDAFDTEETKLLEALADNLAYGITMLRSHKKSEAAEHALRKSEHNFRSITEQMADEVIVVDSLGTLTYVSPVVEQLFGYLPPEVIGHSFVEFIEQEDIPQALQIFDDTLQQKTPNHIFELKLKRKDGSFFDGEIHLQYYQDQDITGMIGLIRDISDRKLAESKAQEMNARYEATIEAAELGTWDWNVQTGEAILNSRWFEIIGYTPEELAPVSIQTWVDSAHPDDFKESMAIAEKLFNGELPYYEQECRMKHKNGSWVWVLDRGSLMSRTADGKPLRVLGTHIDINDRKQAEQALRSSERKFRSITEQIAEMVFLTDSSGTLTYVSPSAEKIYGNLPHEMVGHSFTEFLAEDEIAKAVDLFRETLSLQLSTRTVELTFRKNNGSFFVGEVHFQFYVDNETSGGIGIIHDITERKNQEILQHQYEVQLKESQQFLACIYEDVDYSITVVDIRPDGGFRLKGINPIHEQITGLHNEDVKGKTPEELLDPHVAAIIINNYERCVREGIAIHFEECVPFFGKKPCWETTLNPVRDEAGNIYRIISTSTNITERKKANEQLKKMSAAVEQSPAVVVITDSHGTIEYVNPRFTDLTGYTIEETQGKNPQILQSGMTPKSVYDELWKTILSGSIWRGEWQNKKKNGDLFWESVVISAILNSQGVITNFVAVKEDITEQKKIFEELIEAKEKAEESDRVKSAFLANISHEIRTPMNGILGFSELLKEPHLSGEETAEFIELIQKSGHRMLNLINDLIDISRIDAEETKVEISETPLNDLMYDIYAFFKPNALSKGLRLTYTPGLADSESLIITDSGKLTQILTKIINNALKFTIKGGVDFGYRRKENILEFYVIDSGIGIPVEMQDKVFDRFHQVDNSLTRGYEGAGLGLSISNAFVKLLGGTFHVESIDAAGTTFSFTLPYNPVLNPVHSEHAAELSTQCSALSSPALCILIVEDDEMSTLLLKKNFKGENFCLHYAENGWEALELIRHHPEVNLVLMDIKMPVMNGFEATKLIKQLHPDLPVIAQSAFTSQEDREKARDAGCDDFITKPINKHELLEKIQALLIW